MASMKPEDAYTYTWQGYNLQAPSSYITPGYETNSHLLPSSNLPNHGRYHQGQYLPVNLSSMQARPPRREGHDTGLLPASPPTLSNHQSYPSLKRSFHKVDTSPYDGNLPDLSVDVADLPKRLVNHGLLSFHKVPDEKAVVDNNEQVHQILLSAQVHGMFFLSEMSNGSVENIAVHPELTCYRRNLFQISGEVTIPKGSLSLLTERGEQFRIESFEVSIQASESVDGHPVKLVVIPWKTPPPNSPEIVQDQDQEPSPIPLLQSDEEELEDNREVLVCSFAYKRLQFRIATANNGRRRELQQHFTLHLNVIAISSSGVKIDTCQTVTAPIVVRGRSPRNFQARKEIPLVGSSTLRGHLPDLYLTTSLSPGIVPGPDSKGKPRSSKSHNQGLLPEAFAFDSDHLLTQARNPKRAYVKKYPSFLGPHQNEQNNVATTPTYSKTAAGVIGPNNLNIFNSSSDSLHSQQSSARQYTFQNSPPFVSPLGFSNSNPRSEKCPQHTVPAGTSSNTFYQEYSTPLDFSHSEINESLSRDDSSYFPPTLPLQVWRALSTAGVYDKANEEAKLSNVQHYAVSSREQMKDESQPQRNQSWNPV